MENITEQTRNSTDDVLWPQKDNTSILDVGPSGGQIVSDEMLETGFFVLNCFLVPIFTIVGVTGNGFSLVVLLHHNMRTGVNMCLAAMAVSDSMFLITAMMRRATCIIDKFDPATSDRYKVESFAALFYLNFVFARITTCLTLLITVNRFVAVLFPLRMKFWSGRASLAGAIVFIYVATFLLILPVALVYEVGEVVIPGSNDTKPYLSYTEFFLNNQQFVLDYSQSFLIIFFRYIPAIVLVILNLSIAIALRRSNRLREKLATNRSGGGKGEDQKSVTKVLLVISGLFLLALLPGNAVVIVQRLIPEFSLRGQYTNAYALVNGVTFLLEIINSSVNFVVYMALSNTFSRTYLELFGCRRGVKQKKSSTGESLQVPSQLTTTAQMPNETMK